MERGSDKHGSRIDDQMKGAASSLESSGTESRVDGARADETVERPLLGSQSSADVYPHKDHGEVGGASHPKPKEASEEEKPSSG